MAYLCVTMVAHKGFPGFRGVEEAFYRKAGSYEMTTRIPYVMVDNFPQLGMLTALRFLEWAAENPEGTISLPTGKTPEYFIKWTHYFLENWDREDARGIRKAHGLDRTEKPSLAGLRFVQIDEFYPISPLQHNSFHYYVNEFYIRGFGLDPGRAMFINADSIPLAGGMTYSEVFPGLRIDESLRYRECKTDMEKYQRESIFLIDEWCHGYEQKVRAMGGIGFFLGGIGPDGHIAFNIRGSDPLSTTRLTATNFETQAVAATDLGGIEVSRQRLVITIGLGTITYNLDTTAIIIAAGEAKAGIVSRSLESGQSNLYPATVLQRLPSSRFYLTRGAACRLNDNIKRYFSEGEWSPAKSEKAVMDLCRKLDKYGHHLEDQDILQDENASIPGLPAGLLVPHVESSIKAKLLKGLEAEQYQRFLHTGPHHDDIMLGILPHIAHQLRSPTNTSHFAVMTSGFTAVTNHFLKSVLENTIGFIGSGLIQMIRYPNFFGEGYLMKWDKDVYHFLDNVAAGNLIERQRGLSHRVVRAMVAIRKVQDQEGLLEGLADMIRIIDRSYDGEKNPPDVQLMKGMIREFEEELVWAHFGVQVQNIHHLRLGFYTGDIFTEAPERTRDVEPILDLIRSVDPTVISLALDPEGSGPDTHYKVLQAIAEAIRVWGKEKDLASLRIWGYRNVWYRFHPSEVNVIVPASLNFIAVLNASFHDCYLSQVDAPFPSYEYDGTFSDLARKIWVEQMKDVQLLLGKNFFYENPHPRIRNAHGLVYLKEMNVEEFLAHARELERTMEKPGV